MPRLRIRHGAEAEAVRDVVVGASARPGGDRTGIGPRPALPGKGRTGRKAGGTLDHGVAVTDARDHVVSLVVEQAGRIIAHSAVPATAGDPTCA